jgi:hypothetical protein
MNLQERIRKILREETSVNSKEDKLKYLLFKLINRDVEGADLYEHEGSIWLIFTDDEKWVIKLNKKGVLWYDYNFFNSIFKYLSLDVIENQHYITEWVEDTLQNGVTYTTFHFLPHLSAVEDTIQNGVTYTMRFAAYEGAYVEDTIKKGTKIGKVKND